MGLDQYLYKTKREEVGYFRKVNFLQGYFERKYPERDLNCEYIEISEEEVTDIVNKCESILRHVTFPVVENNELPPTWKTEAVEIAQEVLPITTGFFYGSDQYDAWYFLDVREVQKAFEKLLHETNFREETLEYYCWY